MTHPPSRSDRDALLARARACLDAYGADVSRWPAEERALFETFADDYRFERSRQDAALLDAMLGATPVPATDDAFKARLLHGAPIRGAAGSPSFRFADLLPRRLAPVGALAGLAAVGFAAGAVSASEAQSNAALGYADAAVVALLVEDTLYWDADE